ncbi:MAG: hypothetical protein V3V60_04530 [Sphingomonas aquatilis]|jgi:hypothetical protein|uniref:hypothetical protein n=1 Tax=Sphingomonas aquatilis TaxID=93063 RepID=UPI002F2D6D31
MLRPVLRRNRSAGGEITPFRVDGLANAAGNAVLATRLLGRLADALPDLLAR